MTVRWFGGSTWSSAIRGKPRSRKAASSPRRQRCTCRMLLSWTQRTASRRASGSSLSVKVTSAEKCGLPSARESRSMADNESKPKSKHGNKPEKTGRSCASGSSVSGKATSDEKCGMPSARESRSMADNKSKPKSKPGKKPEKTEKAPRPEKGDKPQKAKADKAEQASKEATAKAP